jgi:protein phosphatase
MTVEQAEASQMAHVLSSAIGGQAPQPVTIAVPFYRSDVLMLCTDGLTRHVTESEIRDHLGRDQPAEKTVRELLALALERGGEDNVTVVLGRLNTNHPDPNSLG